MSAIITIPKTVEESENIINNFKKNSFKQYHSYYKEFNYIHDIVKIFGQHIELGLEIKECDDEYLFIGTGWCASIDYNNEKCYICIYEEIDGCVDYNLTLMITNKKYFKPFCNYLDRRLTFKEFNEPIIVEDNDNVDDTDDSDEDDNVDNTDDSDEDDTDGADNTDEEYIKIYDQEDILKIQKIQKNCERWLWIPICKDGSVGINPRLIVNKLENLGMKKK